MSNTMQDVIDAQKKILQMFESIINNESGFLYSINDIFESLRGLVLHNVVYDDVFREESILTAQIIKQFKFKILLANEELWMRIKGPKKGSLKKFLQNVTSAQEVNKEREEILYLLWDDQYDYEPILFSIVTKPGKALQWFSDNERERHIGLFQWDASKARYDSINSFFSVASFKKWLEEME